MHIMTKKKGHKTTVSRNRAYALIYDLIFISIGIVITIFLSKIGAIEKFVSIMGGYSVIASFVAGFFFTSVFTIAPASVALAHIAEKTPIPTVALWGGLGALCGDLTLLFFIEDRFYKDLVKAMKPSFRRYIFSSFHFGFLKWISPLLGAIVIASPLPDEIGVALLGASKIKMSSLIIISLAMNILGIYILIGSASLVS